MTNYEEEYPQWNDWPWQMRNRVFNAQQLSKWIPVSDELRSEIESCTVRFRMAATPYFLSLIDPDDPDDPIRKQCIVSSKELELCPGDMHELPSVIHMAAILLCIALTVPARRIWKPAGARS